MSDENTSGEKENSKKTDDGSSKDNNENKITLTKEKLSEKIVGGRDEGIQKGVKDTITTVNETLGTEFQSVDDLKEGLEGNFVGDVTESDVVQNLRNSVKSKDEKIQNLSKKIQDYRITGKVEKDVSSNLSDNEELLVPFDKVKLLYEQEKGANFVEKDGEVYATKDGSRYLNDDGEYTTYAQSILGYAKDNNLVKTEVSGGTGGSTTPDVTDGENPFITGNITKQAQLQVTNPEKYKRLKKQAQNK